VQSLRFTQESRTADTAIERRLEWLCDRIEERVGRPRAIVLMGSFGRGEGAVIAVDGQWIPVNDIELLVVSSTDCSEALATLAAELLPIVGSDFLDIAWSDGAWSALPLTMPVFDLKYGGQVLRGDPGVLDAIPQWAPAEMPREEALTLLLNRTAGLLSGLDVDVEKDALAASDPRYLRNQITKALVAVGDWHLVRWGAYDSSYRVRAQRFAELAEGALLDASLAGDVQAAYRRKLRPDYSGDPVADLPSCSSALVDHITAAITTVIDRRATCPRRAALAYARPVDDPAVDADNRRLRARPPVARIARQHTAPGVSLRRVLYAGLPLLARAAHDGPESVDEALEVLEPAFDLRHGSGWGCWNRTRAVVIDAWFAMVH
jgi:hypothetical protein